jgi:hypothetical protein
MNPILKSQSVTMSSREIAELTGKAHHHVKRDIEIMLGQLDEDVSNFGGIYIDAQNRRQTEYLLDRYHTEVLVTGYDVKRRAAVIKRWYDLESGTAKPLANQPSIPATMALCELAITVLRPSDSGKVVMLQKAGKATGADTSFLPDYTEDSAPGHVGAMDTASATQLLREYGVKCTAAAFNERLRQIGLLEQRRRKSSGGKEKRFWCIANEGLAYGKNVVSPQSPRETQPHWYRARFVELVTLIGLECAA